jgi:hypothetical protein
MRELSDESCMHQAEQYMAYAERGDGNGSLRSFDHWADSKDLPSADREAIKEAVMSIPRYTRGERGR